MVRVPAQVVRRIECRGHDELERLHSIGPPGCRPARPRELTRVPVLGESLPVHGLDHHAKSPHSVQLERKERALGL